MFERAPHAPRFPSGHLSGHQGAHARARSSRTVDAERAGERLFYFVSLFPEYSGLSGLSLLGMPPSHQ